MNVTFASATKRTAWVFGAVLVLATCGALGYAVRLPALFPLSDFPVIAVVAAVVTLLCYALIAGWAGYVLVGSVRPAPSLRLSATLGYLTVATAGALLWLKFVLYGFLFTDDPGIGAGVYTALFYGVGLGVPSVLLGSAALVLADYLHKGWGMWKLGLTLPLTLVLMVAALFAVFGAVQSDVFYGFPHTLDTRIAIVVNLAALLLLPLTFLISSVAATIDRARSGRRPWRVAVIPPAVNVAVLVLSFAWYFGRALAVALA